MKTIVFIALATFLVGAVAVTAIDDLPQAEARKKIGTCNPNSPNAGNPPPCGGQ